MPHPFITALFESAPPGLAVWSADLRYVAVNDSLARINGVPREAHVGATPRRLLGGLGAAIERHLTEVLRTGEPVVEALQRGATPARPGAERVWRASYFPLAVTDRAPAVGATVTDVTDQVVAEAALRLSEERFRLLVEGVRDYAIMMLDAQGRVTSWNVGAQRILGYPADDILGRDHALFWPPDLRPHGPRQLLARAAARGSAETESWHVRRDGSRFWAHTAITTVREPDGAVRGYAKVVLDRTQQRQTEQAVRDSEAMLRSLVDSAPDGVLVVDEQGRIVSINPRAEQLFGYPAAELVGRPIEVLVPQRLRDVHRGYRDGYLEHPRTRPMGASLDLTARRKDGSEFPVEVGLGATTDPGQPPRVTVVVTDITARREAEHALVRQATHDALTGLPNRLLFVDRLQHALAGLSRNGEGELAVLFCDVDRFKVVNDSLGHEAGDQVLRTVAARLRTALRPTDTIARFGGDEFVVLAEGLTAAADANVVARRVLTAFEDPIPAGGRDVVVGSSVGIATTADATTEPEVLLRDADAAMYRAKERGRGRIELFDEDLRAQVVERMELEHGLRQALAGGGLWLAYQPIVDLGSGAVTGVEALARWHRPDGTVVPPNRFIPVAEETGLIVPLGAHVLRAACATLSDWAREGLVGPRFTLSVNLSVHQLGSAGLADVIEESLADEHVTASQLQLEITESDAFRDDHSVTALEGLQELGVKLAIDDFGTGHSSLSRLRDLSIDVLKIDRSFVSGLGRESGESAVVEAIVRLAQAYDLATVAEGVETAEQVDALLALGCRSGQGYRFGHPADAATITAALRG